MFNMIPVSTRRSIVDAVLVAVVYVVGVPAVLGAFAVLIFALAHI